MNKNRTFIRLLAMLLTVIMAIGCMSTTVFATETKDLKEVKVYFFYYLNDYVEASIWVDKDATKVDKQDLEELAMDVAYENGVAAWYIRNSYDNNITVTNDKSGGFVWANVYTTPLNGNDETVVPPSDDDGNGDADDETVETKAVTVVFNVLTGATHRLIIEVPADADSVPADLLEEILEENGWTLASGANLSIYSDNTAWINVEEAEDDASETPDAPEMKAVTIIFNIVNGSTNRVIVEVPADAKEIPEDVLANVLEENGWKLYGTANRSIYSDNTAWINVEVSEEEEPVTPPVSQYQTVVAYFIKNGVSTPVNLTEIPKDATTVDLAVLTAIANENGWIIYNSDTTIKNGIVSAWVWDAEDEDEDAGQGGGSSDEETPSTKVIDVTFNLLMGATYHRSIEVSADTNVLPEAEVNAILAENNWKLASGANLTIYSDNTAWVNVEALPAPTTKTISVYISVIGYPAVEGTMEVPIDATSVTEAELDAFAAARGVSLYSYSTTILYGGVSASGTMNG